MNYLGITLSCRNSGAKSAPFGHTSGGATRRPLQALVRWRFCAPLEIPAERSGPFEVPAPGVVVGTVNGVEQLMLHLLDPRIGQGVLIDDFTHGFAEPGVVGPLIPNRGL